MVLMTLRLICMPAQIILMMAFTQIMDIWRPGRSMEDHLTEAVIIYSREWGSANYVIYGIQWYLGVE